MTPMVWLVVVSQILAGTWLEDRWQEQVARWQAEWLHPAPLPGENGLGMRIETRTVREGIRPELMLTAGTGGRWIGAGTSIRLRGEEGGWWRDPARMTTIGGAFHLRIGPTRWQWGHLRGQLGSGLLAGSPGWGISAGVRSVRRLLPASPRGTPAAAGEQAPRMLLAAPLQAGAWRLAWLDDPRRGEAVVLSIHLRDRLALTALAGPGGRGLDLLALAGRDGWALQGAAAFWEAGKREPGRAIEVVFNWRQAPLRGSLEAWYRQGAAAPFGRVPAGASGRRPRGVRAAVALLPAVTISLEGSLVAWQASSPDARGNGWRREVAAQRSSTRGWQARVRRLDEQVLLYPAWLPGSINRLQRLEGWLAWRSTAWTLQTGLRSTADQTGGRRMGWCGLERRWPGLMVYVQGAVIGGQGGPGLYRVEPGPVRSWRMFQATHNGVRLLAGVAARPEGAHLRLAVGPGPHSELRLAFRIEPD